LNFKRHLGAVKFAINTFVNKALGFDIWFRLVEPHFQQRGNFDANCEF